MLALAINSWSRKPIMPPAYRFERFAPATCAHASIGSSLHKLRGGSTMSGLLPNASLALVLLRGMVALIFLAHAVVRLVNGSAPQFGAFLENAGFPQGYVLVLLISAYEIIGGSLLALGIRVKWVCAGLMFIVLMGIVLIHSHLGWFVGEHGVGGMEFSWLLVFALLMLAAVDRDRDRLKPAEESLRSGVGNGAS
jgi:putative oxidoreductase